MELNLVKAYNSLKPDILFYNNGLAILTGFHNIPQNIVIVYMPTVTSKCTFRYPLTCLISSATY